MSFFFSFEKHFFVSKQNKSIVTLRDWLRFLLKAFPDEFSLTWEHHRVFQRKNKILVTNLSFASSASHTRISELLVNLLKLEDDILQSPQRLV